MCFTCSVAELGDGWQAQEVDRSVMHPHLRLVPASEEPGVKTGVPQEILPFAQDFLRIPLSNIRDPEQSIRTKYDEQDLLELGDSMLNERMLYPVIVEQVSENFYEVMIGSRRVRAARMREMLDIPALVVSPQSPLTKIIMMFVENAHRVNLDPFEEAKVFLRLMREHNLDTAGIAEKIKKPTYYITERIKLLSLPEDVQQLVANGELALTHAAILARIPEKERQSRLARTSITNRLEPRELRRKVSEEIGGMETGNRVVPYRITPEKFAARTGEIVVWFKRVTTQLELDKTTLEDRVLMMGALASLENQVSKVKALIKRGKSLGKKKMK